MAFPLVLAAAAAVVGVVLLNKHDTPSSPGPAPTPTPFPMPTPGPSTPATTACDSAIAMLPDQPPGNGLRSLATAASKTSTDPAALDKLAAIIIMGADADPSLTPAQKTAATAAGACLQARAAELRKNGGGGLPVPTMPPGGYALPQALPPLPPLVPTFPSSGAMVQPTKPPQPIFPVETTTTGYDPGDPATW